MWCVLAQLHPSENHADRVSNYIPHENELIVNGLEFPVTVNKLKEDNTTHVNLLVLTLPGKSHYVLIKNMSRLLSKQLSAHDHLAYVCNYCLHSSSSLDLYEKHESRCSRHNAQRVHLPKAGNNYNADKVKFKDVEKQLRLPFVNYSDFESILPKVQGCERDPLKPGGNTTKDSKHMACSFATYIVSSDDRFYKRPYIYVGEDASHLD